tara:strand:+ start:608 stop:892 length:285 start_codon:yes stop_codon:yes gene_type:complete
MPTRLEFNMATGVSSTLDLTADEVKELNAMHARAPAEKWAEVRKERDLLLSATDWWTISDSPDMTDAQTSYRQALRDLPADHDDPFDITWPTAP